MCCFRLETCEYGSEKNKIQTPKCIRMPHSSQCYVSLFNVHSYFLYVAGIEPWQSISLQPSQDHLLLRGLNWVASGIFVHLPRPHFPGFQSLPIVFCHGKNQRAMEVTSSRIDLFEISQGWYTWDVQTSIYPGKAPLQGSNSECPKNGISEKGISVMLNTQVALGFAPKKSNYQI